MQQIQFRLRILISTLLLIVLVGTLGFMLLEKFTWVDSLYFTVTTITTVGYGDIHPVTILGKMLAVLLILTGVGAFLGVVANATEWVLSRREQQQQQEKTHTVMGVFMREMGDHLLQVFSQADPQTDALCQVMQITPRWGEHDYRKCRAALQVFKFRINPERLAWNELRQFLKQRNDLLLRLLENPSLLEHELATELLRAVFHLADELGHRKNFKQMQAPDREHLVGDVQRAFTLLAQEWLTYMQVLQVAYPYLFSLALRLNPFDPKASAVVTQAT